MDIARELNVSTTTISFVLNGKAEEKRISEQVANAVLKYVEEVGYKPNTLAKSLRTGKSNIIGLMIEDIANPFFANIARNIEEKAYNSGYKIIYCSTDNDAGKMRELITMFNDRHVDGYIMTPSAGMAKDIEALTKAGLPVVLFDRYLPEFVTDYVVIDNEQSCYNATKHLTNNGCTNVVFITLASQQTQMQERIKGYKRAQHEVGFAGNIKEIEFHEDPVVFVNKLTEFLEQNYNIDGILFGTNYLTINGLKAIQQTGLVIPTDIAVVAFDDHELFELYKPSISAVAQPIEEIATQVISLLLSKLDGRVKMAENQFRVLPTKLIIRDSSVNSFSRSKS